MEFQVAGGRVFAATGGRDFDPALPPLVFLHGAGMDHSVWVLQARYLAHRGHAVAALDLPGHGRSAGPALPTIRALADWLALALEALAPDRPARLVGHSMGALVALDCAARHPERVAALALLGAAAAMPVHPDLLALAEANDHRAAELIVDWAHGGPAHKGGHPAPGLWMLGGGEKLLERAAPGLLHNDLAACASYGEGAEVAARVSCPTLVVTGAEDRMTPPKAGRALAQAIPGAALAEIEGAGHMMMIEQADATLDALRDFLGAVATIEKKP